MVKPKSMIGKFFLTFEDYQEGVPDRVRNQGQILDVPERGWYLIQAYSFLTGMPTEQRLISFPHMQKFRFYDTNEEMRNAYTIFEMHYNSHVLAASSKGD